MSEQHNHATNVVIIRELLTRYPINPALSPSAFVRTYWSYYHQEYSSNNAINGAVFENLIIIALARAGIQNIYYQTELTYVHSAIFDIFLYSLDGSVALSIKTTLRERWKQADLEALAIKQVHKEVACYVITLSHQEVKARRKNDSSYAGLDAFVLADTEEFDLLVRELSQRQFTIAGSFPIIKTDHKLYTLQKLQQDFSLN